MYKVLLVDDEPAALEALRLAADWEKTGYVICGECGNGEEAVKLVESLRPDLIVTDVRMPVMDGLDFVRHVVERMPGGNEFILVSGYDEFEYAKRAIKYGIRHYVLKPVVKEEFTGILAEVTARFEQRDRLKDLDVWDRDIEAHEYYEKLIYGAHGENPPVESPAHDSGGLPGRGYGVFWFYAIVKPYFFRTFAANAPDRLHISCDELKSELEMPDNGYSVAYIAQLHKEGYGLVLRCSGEDTLANIAVTLRESLARVFSASFYLAASSPADSPAVLGKLVSEALAALNFRFYQPMGSILFYEDYRLCKFNYSLDCIEGRDDICESLENLDIARLTASVETVFEAFAQTMTAPEVVELYLTNIVYKGLELIKSMNGSIEEMVRNYPDGMLNFAGLALNEAKTILLRYCKDVLRLLCRLKSADRQSDMLRVKEYISRHYKSSLTIREMSSQFYIHPVYLGHLIHKWFGCSFNEYVHKLRIEEAKRLLADTGWKAGDIAVEVGYGEYGSFLKQFEKYARMKPAEYRDKCN